MTDGPPRLPECEGERNTQSARRPQSTSVIGGAPPAKEILRSLRNPTGDRS